MSNILYAVTALGLLGAGFGVVLTLISGIFTDDRDPREEKILEHLPGGNCGGCGYPGCRDCAAAVAAGEAPITACEKAEAEHIAAIGEIMGEKLPEKKPMVAFVRCNGGCNVGRRYRYVGLQDCFAASQVAGGPLECAYGCLGCGSCVKVCRFDALRIRWDGVAVVSPAHCTNCMECAEVCPRDLIISVPAEQAARVACANRDGGVAAKAVCEVSCIGCGLCQKACDAGAIRVEDRVAVIDYSACTDCGDCAKVCPRDAVFPLASETEKKPYRTDGVPEEQDAAVPDENEES